MKAIWFVPPVIAILAERAGLVPPSSAVLGTATASSDEQFEALCTGRQDLAVTAMDNVVMWNRREGPKDFRIVAQVEATTSLTLVARPGTTTVADLAGGTLLVDSADNGFVVVLRTMLADAGVRLDGYGLVEAGGVRERLERLMAGEGDATLLGPPFVDIATTRGFHRMIEVDRAYPGFPGQGVVVRAARAAEIHQALAGWLAALETARAAARADPAAASAVLVASGLSAPAAAGMAGAIGDTLDPDAGGIALLLDQRRRLGLPGGGDGYDALVDRSLLREATALARPAT